MTPNQLLKNFLPNSFPLTPATLTGNVNDYAPGSTGGILRLSSDASRTITGFSAKGNDQLLWIINVGSFDIVLANASGSSSAANQILTSTGANITIPALGVALLFYDVTTSRWRANLMVGSSSSGGGGGLAIYGDGSDGNVTISSNTALTRDMYYDTLTVDATFTLDTAGFIIYCKTEAIINGFIAASGLNASGATGGAAVGPSGTLGVNSSAGASGGTGAGSAASARTNSLGASGGAGGAGSGGAGGAGGTASAPLASEGGAQALKATPIASLVRRKNSTFSVFTGGAGGGSGGGDGANAGGGGGSGAVALALFAKAISGSGALSAIGGNGANGVAGNAGGGGGGGGGAIITVAQTSDAVTRSAAGGAAGNGVGTGVNGTAGSNGNIFTLVNA